MPELVCGYIYTADWAYNWAKVDRKKDWHLFPNIIRQIVAHAKGDNTTHTFYHRVVYSGELGYLDEDHTAPCLVILDPSIKQTVLPDEQTMARIKDMFQNNKEPQWYYPYNTE